MLLGNWPHLFLAVKTFRPAALEIEIKEEILVPQAPSGRKKRWRKNPLIKPGIHGG